MRNTLAIAVLAAGLCFANGSTREEKSEKTEKKVDTRVFELRTYYADAGQDEGAARPLPRPHQQAVREARHDDHRLLERRPIRKEAERSSSTSSPSPARKRPTRVGRRSRHDPEWKEAKAESEKDGKLVKKVESVFLNPTDYSPIK